MATSIAGAPPPAPPRRSAPWSRPAGRRMSRRGASSIFSTD